MSVEQHPVYKNFYTVMHPLLQHKLTILRSKNTTKHIFAELAHEVTMLLAYEATKDLPLTTAYVETPLERFEAPMLMGKKPVVLPILRAGIGMVEGVLSLMPAAKVGHIGIYRDEKTLQPQTYFFKIPKKDIDQRHFFVCDPMLATGGSAVAAIDKIKAEGACNITFLCLVAAPQGAKKMYDAHPDVAIYAANLDRDLNEKSYIIPGLGDAGDRLFGTI